MCCAKQSNRCSTHRVPYIFLNIGGTFSQSVTIPTHQRTYCSQAHWWTRLRDRLISNSQLQYGVLYLRAFYENEIVEKINSRLHAMIWIFSRWQYQGIGMTWRSDLPTMSLNSVMVQVTLHRTENEKSLPVRDPPRTQYLMYTIQWTTNNSFYITLLPIRKKK